MCCSFLGLTQKSDESPLQPTDSESVSGHVSTLPSGSELSKLEQRFTTDSIEHAPQVNVVFHSVLLWMRRGWLSDANVSIKLVGKLRRYSAEQVLGAEQNVL